MFVTALSQTVVATILPMIVADIGGFDRYTWAATSYIISATVCYPIAGRLSDIYGRRRFLIAGMVIFIIGAALVGFSSSMTELIIFRVLQGIGGGVVLTCCYISVADLFPAEDRGKQYSMLGAVYGVASIAGPVLGGIVADLFSWQWAFILISLGGIPILVLTAVIYPAHQRISEAVRLDFPGMVVLVLAVVPLFFALSMGGIQYDWNTPQIILPLTFGLVMSVIFIFVETRASVPVMPLEIYSYRVVSLSVFLALLTSIGLYGSVLFLPLFSQAVMGVSATTSGKLLVPMLLAIVAGGILSGQLLSRTGGYYRAQLLVGTGLMTLGIYLLSTMDETTSLFRSVIYIAITGFGFGGGTATTLAVAVQNRVPHALVGAATSTLQFFRSLGGVLGLAVLGALMAVRFGAVFDGHLPDRVRQALPPGELEEIKNNPDALGEQSAMKSDLAQIEPDGEILASMLHDSLVFALKGALNEVFVTMTILTSLSFIIAIFFRMPQHQPTVQEM